MLQPDLEVSIIPRSSLLNNVMISTSPLPASYDHPWTPWSIKRRRVLNSREQTQLRWRYYDRLERESSTMIIPRINFDWVESGDRYTPESHRSHPSTSHANLNFRGGVVQFLTGPNSKAEPQTLDVTPVEPMIPNREAVKYFEYLNATCLWSYPYPLRKIHAIWQHTCWLETRCGQKIDKFHWNTCTVPYQYLNSVGMSKVAIWKKVNIETQRRRSPSWAAVMISY